MNNLTLRDSVWYATTISINRTVRYAALFRVKTSVCLVTHHIVGASVFDAVDSNLDQLVYEKLYDS
jgi:hypothetical protein